MPAARKKLIEVALPLETINKVAAQEKSPSQRHLSAATIARCCCTKECAKECIFVLPTSV